jgi:hypothetical protein
MKATDITKLITEWMPTELHIKRINGGDWIVTDYLSNRDVGSFSQYEDLVAFLKQVAAFDDSEDVLKQSDVDMNMPVEREKLDYYLNPVE